MELPRFISHGWPELDGRVPLHSLGEHQVRLVHLLPLEFTPSVFLSPPIRKQVVSRPFTGRLKGGRGQMRNVARPAQVNNDASYPI